MKDEQMISKLWYMTLHHINRDRRLSYYKRTGTLKRLRDGTEDPDLLRSFFTAGELSVLKESDETAVQLYRRMQEEQIRFVFFGDPGYPASLLQIPDPPLGLFYCGSLPETDAFCVGIVGARKCTEYGRTIAQEIGRRLSRQGIRVISGMARGIDSAAHAGALSAQGKTYAVLGCGCDICYPSSSAILYEQMKKTGGIISEYAPGTEPLPFLFPERNRIISGLSDVLVVCEAKYQSGTIHTVDSALDQGRDVYAVPGRITDKTSCGCNRLLEQGAFVLYDLDRFVAEVVEKAEQKRPQSGRIQQQAKTCWINKPLEKEMQLVYSCLDLHPKNVMVLMEETHLPLDRLLSVLSDLVRERWAEEVYMNSYIRTSV